MKSILLIILINFSLLAMGQTNTFPSSGNVGIGTLSPAAKLEVLGNISLPSQSGDKKIYTWSPLDENWRIGMSVAPGFTTSMATGHVQYLSYGGALGQGFAVGVNGGLSSFEINGGNHNSFFRGNVGIGTTNPSSKLSFGTAIQARMFSLYDDVNDWYGMGIQSYQMRFQVGTSNARFSFLAGDNSEVMTVKGSGNIGIGTTSPVQKLEVNGNLRIDGQSGFGHSELQFFRADGAKFATIGQGDLALSNSTFDIQHYNGNDIRFLNTGVEQVRIVATNGNVGIGTTTPGTFKLAVNGKIWGTEVQVALTNPGPDYVFDKSYALPTLEEVKSYIDENKHLPEVPSAKEMEANGVNVGEMNMLLLKKIEELTLYTIEMNKRMNDLSAENKELKNRVNKIENK
jgi:hypothetical protein